MLLLEKEFKDFVKDGRIDDAVKTIKEKGRKPKTIIMPAGSLTVPLEQK